MINKKEIMDYVSRNHPTYVEVQEYAGKHIKIFDNLVKANNIKKLDDGTHIVWNSLNVNKVVSKGSNGMSDEMKQQMKATTLDKYSFQAGGKVVEVETFERNVGSEDVPE